MTKPSATTSPGSAGASGPRRLDFVQALAAVRSARLVVQSGVVREVVGLVVRALVPELRHGDVVDITLGRGADSALRVPAEVVGFRGDEAILMPLGNTTGIGPDSRVVPCRRPLSVRCSRSLMGRVLDGLGRPMDGGPAIDGEDWPVDRLAPNPLARPRIRTPLATGVRCIDGFATLGQGQRIGLFAAAGVGKSTLLGQIARSSDADVAVICMVGERGREVVEFLEDCLGQGGRARSVVVCATSDAPSLVRLRSAHVATAIAEWFRERQGERVLLLMDSLTRFARAQREVGLSAGEAPVRQGYPASVFAALPRLAERAGASARGSITAIYTILVAADDMDEPIADEAKSVLDGHIVLDRSLAARSFWPPVNVVDSVSRAMSQVVSPEHLDAAGRARELLAVYSENRDIIALGAYQPGREPRLDEAIAMLPALEAYLRQRKSELTSYDDAVAQLLALVRRGVPGERPRPGHARAGRHS